MVARINVQNSNVRCWQHTAGFIAVFVGATAGIGRATLEELLHYGGETMKVYIVGRAMQQRSEWLESLRVINPTATVIIIESNVALLEDVAKVCRHILVKETKVDMLFMSAGMIAFEGRKGQ